MNSIRLKFYGSINASFFAGSQIDTKTYSDHTPDQGRARLPPLSYVMANETAASADAADAAVPPQQPTQAHAAVNARVVTTVAHPSHRLCKLSVTR